MVVVTYNVRSFRGGVKAVSAALDRQPDIMLLQECGRRRTLAAFAGALGMEFVSSHRPFSSVRNAVLWRAPWRMVAHHVHDLPSRGRALRRGFVLVRLRASSQELAAASAHLGLVPRERESHAREITDRMLGTEGRLLLGIDLNEGPEGPAYRWIAGRLYDASAADGDRAAPTFPAAAPTARIDVLFVGEGASVVASSVAQGPTARSASDHLPVVADIEFEGAA